jgi:uroporphyrinogen-III decarboxylase
MRPEVGFTPRWFRQHLDIDFGERWHTDPEYRQQTAVAMRRELEERFSGTDIGGTRRPDLPLDMLTGTYGACTVAAIYGVPIVYAENNWPNCQHSYLTDEEADRMQPPDLDTNPHFQQLLDQVKWIAQSQGCVDGFINWQGVLNNAQRLRGQQIFLDMHEAPERAAHLFDCVCTTMIDAAGRLHARQRASGVEIGFFTVSNCLVNMISPAQYCELLLPLDRRIAQAFHTIGIHNCAWNADPYLEAYATIPNVGYIDMGLDSDMERARRLFSNARRAIMYTPMDLANKPLAKIREDFCRIAHEYAPCDIVLADIEAGTPDERVRAALDICDELSR